MSNTLTNISQILPKVLNLRESTRSINFKNEERFKNDKKTFGNLKDVLNLIKELPGNKATVSNDISVSVLKDSISVYYEKLIDIFNNCI